MLEIFWRFLILGLTSFGGPAAHLGYFRHEFVERLKWLDEQHYTQLIALSQFLPGPGSSQVGFAIGLHRGGLIGATLAFIAFTTPSFLFLYWLAIGIQDLNHPQIDALIHGLKLLALVVVVEATWSMWQNLCQSWQTRLIALISMICLLSMPSFITQITLLIVMITFGTLFLPTKPQAVRAKLTPLNPLWLGIFLFIFILSFIPWKMEEWQLFSQFYQAGSLVFGGGHVVLPLLQQTLPNSLSTDSFLTAYAAAQAAPGPMFTLSAFLGAESLDYNPLLGALIATIAIFLPGFLLVLAVHKHWQNWAKISYLSGAMTAVNASVVGFLLATIFSPIAPNALLQWTDILFALFGFYLLKKFKLSIFWLILLFCSYGLLGSIF